MNMPDLAVQALALTINHLKQFGFERMLCLGASFRSLSSSTHMTLSANALQQLEVIYFVDVFSQIISINDSWLLLAKTNRICLVV